MEKFVVRMEVSKAKLEEIFTRLFDAKEEIYKCYSELEHMGILKISEESTGNEPVE